MSNYRIKPLKWLAPEAIVGALGVAACGGDDQPDTVEVSSGNRAAQLADAERYVDLQKDRGSRACMWTSEINNTPVFRRRILVRLRRRTPSWSSRSATGSGRGTWSGCSLDEPERR
jgi:hypothetical protein